MVPLQYAPAFFYQLWVVHSLIEGKVLPFAYFLIPGATEEIYTRAFKILQEGIKSLPSNRKSPPGHNTRANPDDDEKDEATLAAEKEAQDKALGPSTIIMNYETAQYNAFVNTFCRVLRRGTDTQQGILTLGLDLY
ncbi:hypothetical protein DSO57_1007777 [Entomophthora muscae]|uniref:Uncharacterized protein n=1 Tax=Entomophthora muscae TaxID=34485 RepID=A0ACC2USZ0_9FUNG|nr:hypothetical protein DSO57_1007777 [Entomophthora muscae]